MAETSSGNTLSTTRLIFVPAAITLGVTILRLVGELQHWPKPWFVTSAGGGGAIVGIAWLPLIFGPYFALKLSGSGEGPASTGKSIGFAVLGLAILFAGGFVGFVAQPLSLPRMLIGLVIMAAAAALQFPGWRALAGAILAYGFAARIPVAIVMYFAIQGSWGTHYDALPPGYSGPVDFWPKYVMIGLVPQLVMWVAYTVVVGSLFGTVVAAIARRGKTAARVTT